jgi:hypothetical protein
MRAAKAGSVAPTPRGARAMATALVLEADGRRENGRWKYGAVVGEITESGKSTWRNYLNQCGVVLDFKPDLAAEVVTGAITLNDAFTQAEAIRTSAETQIGPPPRSDWPTGVQVVGFLRV